MKKRKASAGWGTLRTELMKLKATNEPVRILVQGFRSWIEKDGEILQGAEMNSEEPIYFLRERDIKPIDGKMGQDIMHWQSDYPILSRKSVKADGEKGIVVMQLDARDTTAKLRTVKRSIKTCTILS